MGHSQKGEDLYLGVWTPVRGEWLARRTFLPPQPIFLQERSVGCGLCGLGRYCPGVEEGSCGAMRPAVASPYLTRRKTGFSPVVSVRSVGLCLPLPQWLGVPSDPGTLLWPFLSLTISIFVCNVSFLPSSCLQDSFKSLLFSAIRIWYTY